MKSEKQMRKKKVNEIRRRKEIQRIQVTVGVFY